MNLRILRAFDRHFGPIFLMVVAPVTKRLAELLPKPSNTPKRFVFLKIKGGGSLIIAMPALLALRRAEPGADFALVCTRDAKIYAELTGVFNRYFIIDDKNLFTLILSGLRALAASFRADVVIDVEPHGIMASLFTALTLAARRVGLVKVAESYRAQAYTDAIGLSPAAPIYSFYDRLAQLFNTEPSPQDECRRELLKHIPVMAPHNLDTQLIGLAPFASDLAPERMMPIETWKKLLTDTFGATRLRVKIFGSHANIAAGHIFTDNLKAALPNLEIINLCGKQNLAGAVAEAIQCDQFWSIDSGLLHIVRLVGKNCRSFWGPTSPALLLRPIEGLQEKITYHAFFCSPCVHISAQPLCNGNNLCMKTMADPNPDRMPRWSANRK